MSQVCKDFDVGALCIEKNEIIFRFLVNVNK